jgi:hypothetical protein
MGRSESTASGLEAAIAIDGHNVLSPVAVASLLVVDRQSWLRLRSTKVFILGSLEMT